MNLIHQIRIGIFGHRLNNDAILLIGYNTNAFIEQTNFFSIIFFATAICFENIFTNNPLIYQ